MDRLKNTAPDEIGAEDAQDEGQHYEGHIPDLHDVPSLLDDGRVYESCGHQPGDEGGVLHGIPGPVSSPAQLDVGPLSAQDDTDGKKHP